MAGRATVRALQAGNGIEQGGWLAVVHALRTPFSPPKAYRDLPLMVLALSKP